MIEPEMAFCNLQENEDLAEAFLKSQVEQVLRDCKPDLRVPQQMVRPGSVQEPGRPDQRTTSSG